MASTKVAPSTVYRLTVTQVTHQLHARGIPISSRTVRRMAADPDDTRVPATRFGRAYLIAPEAVDRLADPRD